MTTPAPVLRPDTSAAPSGSSQLNRAAGAPPTQGVLTPDLQPSMQHLLDTWAANESLSLRHPLAGARIDADSVWLLPPHSRPDLAALRLVAAPQQPWLQPQPATDWTAQDLAALRAHLSDALVASPWRLPRSPDASHQIAAHSNQRALELQAVFGPGDAIPRVQANYAAWTGAVILALLVLLTLRLLAAHRGALRR